MNTFIGFKKEEIEKPISERFEKIVSLYPQEVAIKTNQENITYETLNQIANRLARKIITTQGETFKQPIILLFDYGASFIPSILAVWKTGNMYVSLTSSLPETRLSQIVGDSKARLIITDSHNLSLAQKLAQKHLQIINIDNLQSQISAHNLDLTLPDNLPAAIFFTSGSTGVPKGVVQNQNTILHFIYLATNKQKISVNDRKCPLLNFNFAPSATSIFSYLLNGGTICLYDVKKQGLQPLISWLIEEEITELHCATPIFRSFLDILRETVFFPKLRFIRLGGDKLYKSDVERCWPYISEECKLKHSYASSESNLIAEMVIDCHSSIDSDIIPAGYAVEDKEILLLKDTDTNGKVEVSPIGEIGQIAVKSPYLSPGYWQNPQLTQEKFLADFDGSDCRIYLTGDLGRFNNDGCLKVLGRKDFMVKIRGLRVELAEIEANLREHPQIKQTVVIATGNNPEDQKLIGYFIPTNKNNLHPRQLLKFLEEKLPDYMIPSAFVALESFPLNANGKIDRNALPKPDFEANRENEFIAPRTETERKLAGIWQEVLGIEKIGVNDNFFALGGNSLLATQVVSRIENSFQVEFPLHYLFEFPTIEELGVIIEQSGQETQHSSIPMVSRKQELPLSFAQERLWFITQLEGSSFFYNMSVVSKIEGELEIKALEKAIAHLFQRHESLRSSFKEKEGKPYLIINQQVDWSLPIVNLENLDQIEKQQQLENILRKEEHRVFDLEKDTLLRFTLLKLSSQEYILIMVIHHIISDGWSRGIINEELSHLYQTYRQNKKPTLPFLEIQYLDFAIWQRKYLSEDILQQKISYWQKKLENAPSVSTFPTDYPRPQTQTFRGAKYQQLINQRLTNQLKNFSQQKQVTLFISLLTALKVLLYRHTKQEKLIVGFPIAGRNNLEIEKLIGFFANTLLIASNLQGDLNFLELLDQVKNCVFKSYEDQDLPFEKLVQELQVERNLSHNPLFQIWFNMVNLESHNLELEGLKVEDLSKGETNVNSKFDLTIYTQKLDDGLELTWVYNQDLYSENTIKWLAQQYQTLLEEIVIDPERKINEIPLLTKNETRRLFRNKNLINPENSGVNLLASEIEQSIPSRFEKQVQLNPQKIAITSKKQQWSYEQLNQKANQIAAQILSLSIQKQEQIALLFEHDAEMIAALLGVLKTGKIYVPLDPTYPQARLNYTLKDSQSSFLLTNNANYDLAKELSQGKIGIINVDIFSLNTDNFAENVTFSLNPDTIAYILYTSGSTGQPKGVVQNHRNVLHFIRNYTNNLQISSTDKLSLLASYSFDAAVMDIFGALLNGATLCLYDLKANGINKLPLWLQEEEITIYHSTPTLYRYLLQEISTGEKNLLSKIRLLVLGGEEVVQKDVELYRDYFRENCLFMNGYGSSESSFNLRYLINHQTSIDNRKVVIGYPFENTEILLVDEQGRNTQICGEIAIKSKHIALGYWQQPELTQKVFLTDSQDSQKRIYRTGDWGRLRSDGTIEFLGRKDFQIKIRGIRLELGEIEANLNQHPQIKENAVIVRENKQGDQYLAAYLISKDKQPERKELRQFLGKKLPEYMIPAAFLFLDAFPLTPNGKIDRKALPETNEEANREDEFIAPRNEMEMKLAQIWQEVLNIEQVGINDNFFALGGHSLLATQVVSRISNSFGVELPLRSLFEFSTIGELSEHFTHSYLTKSRISLSENQNRTRGEI